MSKLLATLLSASFLIGGIAFAQVEVEPPSVEVEPPSIEVDAPEVEVDLPEVEQAPGVEVTDSAVVVEIPLEEGVDFGTTQYAGASIGLPGGIHYGLRDVDLFGLQPDLRFRLSGNLIGLSVVLGADALFDIAQVEENIQLYGGGGAELGTSLLLIPTIGIHGLVGAEYRINQDFGLFGEAGSGLEFPFIFTPRFTGGVNYHF